MENEILRMIITILLLFLLFLLIIVCHAGVYGMARVYNWNGRRYCYLGFVPIRRKNGDMVVRIGEHMTDLSRTTAYRICVSRAFCRKNRYREMLVYVDGEKNYLLIDSPAMWFS